MTDHRPRVRAEGICTTSGKAQLARGDAERLARFRRRRDHDNLEVYRCPDCRRWHLGHGSPKPRRTLRRRAT